MNRINATISAAVLVIFTAAGMIYLWRNLNAAREDAPVGPMADDSLANGHSWKVSCGTVDGGTAANVLINVDGGTGEFAVSDYTVTSSSATCVNVGFDTSTDSTHGVPVGFGCAGGMILPMHAKKGRCRSSGAAVVVDVTGGTP